MAETASNYARVLYELSVRREAIDETRRIFSETPQVGRALLSPVVPRLEKERAIDRIFPLEMRNFLKVLCKYQKMDCIDEIFAAYDSYCLKQSSGLRAVLRYVTPPKEEQKEGMIAFLKKEFHVQKAELELKEDKSLIGGFVLTAQGREFDWSLQGRYKKLRQKLMRR